MVSRVLEKDFIQGGHAENGSQDCFEDDKKGNEHRKLIEEVCRVFHEITGVRSSPLHDGAAVMHWARKGWQLYDFRLMIEYEFMNEKRSKYYAENPSKMNLRGFFVPFGERENMVIDTHMGLKALAQKKLSGELRELRADLSPPMLMKCGASVCVGSREAYELHMNECFSNRGLCFFKE